MDEKISNSVALMSEFDAFQVGLILNAIPRMLVEC